MIKKRKRRVQARDSILFNQLLFEIFFFELREIIRRSLSRNFRRRKKSIKKA